MDPFEEFEFKPLNKGLGFHKKPSDMESMTRVANAPLHKTEEIKSGSGPAQLGSNRSGSNRSGSNRMDELNQIMNRIPSFETQMKTEPVKIDPILPREEKNYPGPMYRAPKFKNTDEMLQKKEAKFEPVFEPTLPKHEMVTTQRKETAVNLGAVLFDVLVTVGLLSLFTGVTLAITDSDFGVVWASAQTDLATGLSLGLLAFSVIQFYLILSRSFFGATLGEWAFEITLGSSAQQKSALYPLQVTWRSILVASTGFVILPLIGLLFGKDLAGRLSGVRLGRDI